MALVIVLAFLALLTVLIVAFLSGVTSDYSASQSYAKGATARSLGEQAVQLAMGQIKKATTGTEIAWASQPGMIRTWDRTGAKAAFYKLYSSDSMELTSGLDSYQPESDVAPDWQSRPALFSDLNAPVATGAGNHYPILDGNDLQPLTFEGASIQTYTTPQSGAFPAVEGLSVALDAPVAKATGNDLANPVPMPVKWIYILQDGSLAVPDATSLETATFDTAANKPSLTNPITGRIAFWTDDETCKLNLNTAVGGNFWDVPSFGSGQDLHFSRYQPARNEFNRYPGHPATTSLVPVFWSLGDSPLSSPYQNIFPTITPRNSGGIYPVDVASNQHVLINPTLPVATQKFLDNLFELSPRNSWKNAAGRLAGSAMGLQPTVKDPAAGTNLNPLAAVDSDRLYASVDEALFAQPQSATPTRPFNAFQASTKDIDKLRFFLTTSSRSPETNPFNQPKVTMWPIDDPTRANPSNQFFSGTDGQSPLDKLIAFCSTLNGKPYYFTRNDPTSPTADFTPRNAEVYDYLLGLMSRPVPGFGASLASRFTPDGSARLLTLTYDYIRSAINLGDTTSGPLGSLTFNNDSFNYYFASPPRYVSPGRYDSRAGTAQVVPIKIRNTRGMGRFPVVQQATMHFIARAANQPPVVLNAQGKPTAQINPMHPWTSNPPASATLTPVTQPDGTPTGEVLVSAGNAQYPTLLGQTHAGLPYLTDKTNASGVLAVPNPRYQLSDLPIPSADNSKPLSPHKTQIEAAFYVKLVNVAPGFQPLHADLRVRVKGLSSFLADGQPLFPASLDAVTETFQYSPPASSAVPAFFNVGATTVDNRSTAEPAGSNRRANFISVPVIVGQGSHGERFSFTGGTLLVELVTAAGTVVQTAEIEFPGAEFPTPLLSPMPLVCGARPWGYNSYLQSDTVLNSRADDLVCNYPPKLPSDITPSSMLTFDANTNLSKNPNFGVNDPVAGANAYRTNCTRISINPAAMNHKTTGSFGSFAFFTYPTNNLYAPERELVTPAAGTLPSIPLNEFRFGLTADTIRSVECLYGDARILAVKENLTKNYYAPHRFYFDKKLRPAHSLRNGNNDFVRGQGYTYLSASFAELRNTWTSTVPLVYTGAFPGYAATPTNPGNLWDIASGDEVRHFSRFTIRGPSTWPFITSSAELDDSKFLWPGLTRFSAIWARGGDFCGGLPREPDGPYMGKAEEGTSNIDTDSSLFPYYHYNNAATAYIGDTLFSPNRQVPSPVILGSLPLGDTPADAWRTLLFCPNPVSPTHLSLGRNPPDSLYLDFFHMPVVEPYAISEPFSTAGKVNMNHRLAPFSYIKRDTALRGVLKSVMLTAVPDRHLTNKTGLTDTSQRFSEVRAFGSNTFYDSASVGFAPFRYPIHSGETLKQFDALFDQGTLFRSPSEICGLWLYPAKRPSEAAPNASKDPEVAWSATQSAIKSWWYDNPGGTCKSVTGDNLRERPYSHLYGRLTTKSNSYTVHYRVQVLKKTRGTSPDQWVEGKDQTLSEARGSSLIERYIDPNGALPDFAQEPGANLDVSHKFRVVGTKKFAP